MGDYWLHESSSRRGLWPPFFCRRSRLTGTSRLLCHFWHGLFYGGGWTEAPFCRSAHRVLVVLFPLIHGVGRWNVLRQLQVQLSACNASRQILDYFTQGTHLVGRGLSHLQLLGDTLPCHIARLPRRCGETSLQASRWIIYEGDMG
jgi:hypothetical protein